MTDNVNHPAHYTAGNIECIEAIKAAITDLQGIDAACTANAIKYLWRWKKKNGVEDLKKCVWYVNYLISLYGQKENMVMPIPSKDYSTKCCGDCAFFHALDNEHMLCYLTMTMKVKKATSPICKYFEPKEELK